MSRTDSICSSMHYRAPSRGGRYGSSPQTNAAGHPDRARIQPETVLESEYANRTVTSQRAGSGAVFAVRGSSAKSLWCLNLAESPEIRATFQRDSSRLHSEVRDLSAQPRNRVSVARLSRSWALRAAPFALTVAHVSEGFAPSRFAALSQLPYKLRHIQKPIPSFRSSVNPATARIHRPKAISQNAMSSAALTTRYGDNSKTSCALFRRCGGMLTRPLASSGRSRRCRYATLPFKRHEQRLYSAHCVRTKA